MHTQRERSATAITANLIDAAVSRRIQLRNSRQQRNIGGQHAFNSRSSLERTVQHVFEIRKTQGQSPDAPRNAADKQKSALGLEWLFRHLRQIKDGEVFGLLFFFQIRGHSGGKCLVQQDW